MCLTLAIKLVLIYNVFMMTRCLVKLDENWSSEREVQPHDLTVTAFFISWMMRGIELERFYLVYILHSP